MSGRDDVSNHRRLAYLLNRLFRRRSKKKLKLCVTRLCEGNSPVTGEFPSQRASNAENVNAENVNISWRHDEYFIISCHMKTQQSVNRLYMSFGVCLTTMILGGIEHYIVCVDPILACSGFYFAKTYREFLLFLKCNHEDIKGSNWLPI